jgi:MFS family permease
MLWCVAGFGAFTIVFGLSRNVVVSLRALVLVGATDMISVVVRSTMIQLATPDEMRGRVSAVNMIFVGASNEFGQFESGITAHCLAQFLRSCWVELERWWWSQPGRHFSRNCAALTN